MENLLIAISEFRKAFVVAVGDRSPFAKEALRRIDDAVGQPDRPLLIIQPWHSCHEWKWDYPWEMVRIRHWFYMVNTGFIDSHYCLHVRIFGLRSTWEVWHPTPKG